MPQHDIERAPITRQHGVETGLDRQIQPAVFSLVTVPRKRAHNIGASDSDTNAETATAAMTVTANSRNRRPTIPPIIKSGMNTAISDALIDSTVKRISAEPTQRRLERWGARLDMAVDVLDLDDGIVDHEADGNRERHQ